MFAMTVWDVFGIVALVAGGLTACTVTGVVWDRRGGWWATLVGVFAAGVVFVAWLALFPPAPVAPPASTVVECVTFSPHRDFDASGDKFTAWAASVGAVDYVPMPYGGAWVTADGVGVGYSLAEDDRVVSTPDCL